MERPAQAGVMVVGATLEADITKKIPSESQESFSFRAVITLGKK